MNLDRRTFLLLAGGAGAYPLHGNTCIGNAFPKIPAGSFRFDSVREFQLPPPASKPLERPLWSKLGDDEKARITKDLKCAYTKMMKRRAVCRKSYMYQAWTHAWYCSGGDNPCFGDVHSTWAFLPWHRGFLYFHERLLQSELKNPDFRLPVWDWESSPTVPPVYNELPFPPHLGCNCARAQNSVPPFTDDQIRAWFGSRDFESVAGGVSCAGSAYGGPHLCVHTSLGGCMSHFPSAALDPVFYAHHANVDRFWDAWADKYPDTDRQWPHSCFYFYDHGELLRVQARDLRDTTRLGYRYDRPSIPSSQSVDAFIDNSLVVFDDCARQRLFGLLENQAAAVGRRVSVAVRFRVCIPVEHGTYYVFGMHGAEDQESQMITLDECAGVLGGHESPARAIITSSLGGGPGTDPIKVVEKLVQVSRGGAQMVFGTPSPGNASNPADVSIVNPKPFTPDTFEIRVYQ